MGRVKELLEEIKELAETDRKSASDMLIDKLGYKRDYAYRVIDVWTEKPKGEE